MKVLGSKEREERKKVLIKAVEDALDLGNHYIIVATFEGDKISIALGEFCTPDQKMSVLSKENMRAMTDILRSGKGIIVGFGR